MQVIDRIRHDMQQRLEQLIDEAEKLRHALVALDPRERSAAQPEAKRAAKKASSPKASVAPKRTVSPSGKSRGSARTAPGETRAKVLGALSSERALTAGEVAAATGLARPTVSTTLSKLAKGGEVVKAARGYQLPNGTAASVNGAETTRAPSEV